MNKLYVQKRLVLNFPNYFLSSSVTANTVTYLCFIPLFPKFTFNTNTVTNIIIPTNNFCKD